MRADQWLRQRYPGLTNSQSDEVFRLGLVRDSEKRVVKKGAYVNEDLDVSRWGAQLNRIREGNPDLPFVLVAEESDFFVVDKPAGLAGHGNGIGDADTATQWAFGRHSAAKDEFPEPLPCLTPHRLDTATSGCLIVSKTQASFERWRGLFSEHAVEKEYLAWVWNVPTDEEWREAGEFLAGSGPRGARRVVVQPGTPFSYLAQISFQMEAKFGEASLVRVRTTTGVTHQVRVLLAHAGFPLVGDSLYDPVFGSRSRKTEGHWLRATSLTAEGKTWTVDETEFRARKP